MIPTTKLIKLSLGLTNIEMYLLRRITDLDSNFTSSDVCNNFNCDKSTSQRALKKLICLGVVAREKVCSKNGGYYFNYMFLGGDNFRKVLREKLQSDFQTCDSVVSALSLEDLLVCD